MERKISLSKTFVNGCVWEMDDAGRHRIRLADGFYGPWAPYEHPAISIDGRYVVFTQYWEGYTELETLLNCIPIPERIV